MASHDSGSYGGRRRSVARRSKTQCDTSWERKKDSVRVNLTECPFILPMGVSPRRVDWAKPWASLLADSNLGPAVGQAGALAYGRCVESV
jgi:hypothetical protein